MENNKRKQPIESTAGWGKLQPQAIDLEEGVLGAIMLEKGAYIKIADLLKPESFYKESSVIIYTAIQQLAADGNPIDLLTVSAELRKMGKLEDVGGSYYVTGLTNRVGSSANIEYHARIVAEKYIQRQLIRVGTEIASQAYEDTVDVFELQESAQKKIMELTASTSSAKISTSKELLKEAIAINDLMIKNPEHFTGVTTGFRALNTLTSGWQNSDLIIIAARPAMGKTALAISLGLAPAFKKEPSIFFSLEMSKRQIYARAISQETGIPLESILRRGMNETELEKLFKSSDKLGNAPIYFDDQGALSVFELRTRARRMKVEYGIKLIVVDYLQLMRGETSNKNANREQEIGYISRSLKALAKELDIPVIALAQLSRAVEKRSNPIPVLADLRESGSIEQDADVVIFIHRPEYYGITETEDGQSTLGLAELHIAKHRNGNTGKILLRFTPHLTKFTDWKSESEAINEALFAPLSPDEKPPF